MGKQAKLEKARNCKKCKGLFYMTAKELVEHARECKGE